MRVWVTLYGGLARASGSGEKFALEIPEGETTGGLVRRLEIPRNLIALIAVNGVKMSWDAPLGPDDQVVCFPPVTGGAPRVKGLAGTKSWGTARVDIAVNLFSVGGDIS